MTLGPQSGAQAIHPSIEKVRRRLPPPRLVIGSCSFGALRLLLLLLLLRLSRLVGWGLRGVHVLLLFCAVGIAGLDSFEDSEDLLFLLLLLLLLLLRLLAQKRDRWERQQGMRSQYDTRTRRR